MKKGLLFGLCALTALAIGCGKSPEEIELTNAKSKLPNGEVVRGVILPSEGNQEYNNIYSFDDNLEARSRIYTVIEYIGFPKTNTSITVTNLNQSAQGGSGIISGGSTSVDAKIPKEGIVLKLRKLNEGNTISTYYVIEGKNDIPPNFLLDVYSIGDTVSIPTIRQYDGHYTFKERVFDSQVHLYKILKTNLDILKADELKKPISLEKN